MPGHSTLAFSDWLYVHTSLIWATQREVEEPHRAAAYSMEDGVIAWLVKRGKVTIKNPVESATAGPGTWIFPGSRKGRQTMTPGTVVLSVRFFAGWPDGRPLFDHREIRAVRAAADRTLTRAGEALEGLVRKVSKRSGFYLLSQEQADLESYFAIRLAFEKWISAYTAMMLREGQRPLLMNTADPRVLAAARLLDNRPLRSPLRESELSRSVGLSVSQLNRLFARDLGVSPKKYRERRRLEAARLLLRHDQHTVKETAYELGFNSLPHFSAWFRRLVGTSPRAFQRL